MEKREEIRLKIRENIKERTSLKLNDYFGNPERVVEVIKNAIWNLPDKQTEEILNFIKFDLGWE